MTRPLDWATRLASLALLLALAGCASGPAAGTPQYRAVSPPQPGDSISVDSTTGDVTIDITSERGIGKAEIERTGRPPKTLTLDLHLKGLEELRWSWGDAVLVIHVASGDGTVREELIRGSGQPDAIDDSSPYWAPVRIEADDPAIPLEDGFFAVTAPPAFLQAAPQRFFLQWIDFYR